MRHRAALYLLGLGLVGGVSAGQEGSEVGTFSDRLDLVTVDLYVIVRDAQGRLPTDLTREDLEVLEDGVRQTVIGVELPAAEPQGGSEAPADDKERERRWHTLIYFDQPLCGRRTVNSAAKALAEEVDRLTELGTVEVVAAEDTVTTLQPATRDPNALRDALAEVGKRRRGLAEVATVRRRHLQAIEDDQSVGAQLIPSGAGTSGAAGRPGSVESLGRRVAAAQKDQASRQLQIRAAFLQERAIIKARRDLLLSHLAGYRTASPRVLVLVSDGYDADPRDFYLAGVDQELASKLGVELQEFALEALPQEMARVIAGSNWTTVGLSLGGLRAGLAAPASSRGSGISSDAASGQTEGSGGGARFLMSSPLEPLRRLATESGGELLTESRELEAAVDRLDRRVRVTYQVSRPPDGRIHRVEVRSKRPGIEIGAPRWVGSETPDEVAASRARQIAEGRQMGDLVLESMVLFDSADASDRGATVAARLRLDSLAAVRETLGDTSLRVTTAVFFSERTPFVHHAVETGQDLRVGEHWGYSTHMTLPPDTGVVVIVVEELTTGSWAGSIAPLVRPQS